MDYKVTSEALPKLTVLSAIFGLCTSSVVLLEGSYVQSFLIATTTAGLVWFHHRFGTGFEEQFDKFNWWDEIAISWILAFTILVIISYVAFETGFATITGPFGADESFIYDGGNQVFSKYVNPLLIMVVVPFFAMGGLILSTVAGFWTGFVASEIGWGVAVIDTFPYLVLYVAGMAIIFGSFMLNIKLIDGPFSRGIEQRLYENVESEKLRWIGYPEKESLEELGEKEASPRAIVLFNLNIFLFFARIFKRLLTEVCLCFQYITINRIREYFQKNRDAVLKNTMLYVYGSWIFTIGLLVQAYLVPWMKEVYVNSVL